MTTASSTPSAPTCFDVWGRDVEAALAYEAAISCTQNSPERAFLQRCRQALTQA
ncbi:MAG: hypothetical protein ACRDRG_11220 [Pseudonocardiaceae bacterium]